MSPPCPASYGLQQDLLLFFIVQSFPLSLLPRPGFRKGIQTQGTGYEEREFVGLEWGRLRKVR